MTLQTDKDGVGVRGVGGLKSVGKIIRYVQFNPLSHHRSTPSVESA